MFADVCRKSTDMYDSSTPPAFFSNQHFHQTSSQNIINASGSYYALQRSIDNGSGVNGNANTSNLYFDTFEETGTVNNSTGTTSFWMKQDDSITDFHPNHMNFQENMNGTYFIEQSIFSNFRSSGLQPYMYEQVSVSFKVTSLESGGSAFNDESYWKPLFKIFTPSNTGYSSYNYFRLGKIRTDDLHGWLQTWSHWVVVWDTNEIKMYGSAPTDIFISDAFIAQNHFMGNGTGEWSLSTATFGGNPIGKPAKFSIATESSTNPIRFVLFTKYWWGAYQNFTSTDYPHYPWDNKFCFDEFSHFKNTVLTHAEIIELHNQGNVMNIAGHHTQKDNLWCWYRFGDHASDDFTAGEADGCYDASGEGNHIDIPSEFDSEMQTNDMGGPST